MIEGSALPAIGGMADVTFSGIISRHMIRVHGVLIILFMAAKTGGGSPGVLAVGMTEITGCIYVSARKRIRGLIRVIETGRGPGCCGMTLRAGVTE